MTFFMRSSDRKQKAKLSGGIAVTSALVFALMFLSATSTLLAQIGHTARSLVANDEGSLHLVGESGSELVEEGKVIGTLPGHVKVLFSIGANVIAKFTIYPMNGGSITGQGNGKLRSSGRYASFGGTLTITKGTGLYRHAHGTGGFYGTILRKSPYPVVVQTRGTLIY